MRAVTPPEERSLEDLARAAVAGDAAAADALVAAVADDVYGLALKMLWHPEDAEDAAQEILVKVVTRLATFRGESALRSWVFRIAANHLLTVRRGRMERRELSFDAMAADLEAGLRSDAPVAAVGPDADLGLLAEEVKVGCTQAMLLCLDREHRLAYLLGDVFEISSAEAAAISELAPATHRKRLQRARERIRGFLAGHCGIVNPERPCRCARRIGYAVGQGRVDPAQPLFAGLPPRRSRRLLRGVAEMEGLHDEAARVFREHPEPPLPGPALARVHDLLSRHRLPVVLG